MALRWISARDRAGYLQPLACIAVGGAVYGASIGAWHAPLLAFYVAVKLPILLVATALVDALLNCIWARRFGFELTLGQSLRAVLLAFALASVVLAALAPVMLFFDLTLPGPRAPAANVSHHLLGLAHVAAIACAGITVVLRQRQWLREVCPNAPGASRVVFLWLAVNLLVGAQLSWNLRPWFGSPGLGVQFLRARPFHGTFYESVFRMVWQLTY